MSFIPIATGMRSYAVIGSIADFLEGTEQL